MDSSSSSIVSEDKSQHFDGFKNDIKSVLGPLVMTMDKNIINTQQSQQELGEEIERLIKELETFTDMAGPPLVQNALEKLAGAKKKLANSINLLQQTNSRIERIQESLEVTP
ncbi:hypothetical protein BJ944DRAFT_243154 [Cunninghamella echinulata]|nr:hypothetical protein BJ944DRAFT_243154 [Cunninghamella echinulata]